MSVDFASIVLIFWVVAALGTTINLLSVLHRLGPRVEALGDQPVAIIAPVKNAGPHLAEFLQRLRAQGYANARIIIVVEAMTDPAYAAAVAASKGTGLPMTVRVAGLSVDGGQKVWNLLAGLDALTPADEIVVFADADILPGKHWLGRLVGPILSRRADVTSGYRWLLPAGESWSTFIVAASDHAVAATQRWRFWNVAWGGSCAVRRDVLNRMDIATWWRGAVSDDAQFTRALWAIDRMVVCPPGLLVPSPVQHTFASAFEFGRRQYVIVRTHIVAFWLVSAMIVMAPLAICTMALVRAAEGDRLAIAALLTVFALAQIRFLARRDVEQWVLNEAAVTALSGHSLKVWCGTLAAPIFHAACLLAAWSSRRITWAGVDYEILAPQNIRITRKSRLSGNEQESAAASVGISAGHSKGPV